MKCPNEDCGGKVIQKSADGATLRLRVKGPIEIVDGVCKSQCYWCGTEVTLPIKLDAPPVPDKVAKAVSRPVVERVTVRVGKL